jgi:hypothetical protein
MNGDAYIHNGKFYSKGDIHKRTFNSSTRTWTEEKNLNDYFVMKGVKKSHCFDINNTTEILALHYDDFDFELGTAPGNLASLNLSWQSKEGTYCALCLTATCDLCGNGKYGGLADIYQSLEHGARPTRNRRARSTASLQPCGAEAQSSDPVLSAVRLWALRSRKGTIHINDGRAPYISMYGKREGCYTFPQHRPVLT